MTQSPAVIIHAKDLELDEKVRSSIERRCERIAEEFPEVTRLEITLSGAGVSFDAHGHAQGKNTDVATHGEASEPGPAVDLALDGIEKQLRKVHDKRIFAQRRKAQRDPPKRNPSG